MSFTLHPNDLVCYTDDGEPMVEPGEFAVSVGGGQPLKGFTAGSLAGRFTVEP